MLMATWSAFCDNRRSTGISKRNIPMSAPSPVQSSSVRPSYQPVQAQNDPATIANRIASEGGCNIDHIRSELATLARQNPALEAQVRPLVEARLTPTQRGELARTVSNDNNLPPTATPPASEEGVGSFFEGAIKGDFSNNNSWSATGGQVVVGFIPIVGQVADARDTVAAVGQIWRGESGGWLNLGAAAIGWVPGIGDGIKAGIRGGEKIADASTEVAQHVARNSDEVVQGTARQADDIAAAIPVQRFTSADEFNRAANNAAPSTRYEFGNYSYTTDARGRVATSEGQISLTPTGRNDSALQRTIGQEGRSTDIGFHLIADRFGGQTNRLNVVPGNGRPIGDGLPNLNQGAFKRFENRVAEVAGQSGNNVEVRIRTEYDASNLTNRPDNIIGAYRVNGGRWIEQGFVNK
jgi:DNA/RNA non-specific endonuclease